MAKKVLSIEYDFDFKILGVSSGLKDYRFCWHLNQVLDFEMSRESDIVFPKGSIHNRFSYSFPETERQIHLIANKGSSGFFVPEKKQVDYFLLLKEWNESGTIITLKKQLKTIEQVLFVFEISPQELRSKENFLLL